MCNKKEIVHCFPPFQKLFVVYGGFNTNQSQLINHMVFQKWSFCDLISERVHLQQPALHCSCFPESLVTQTDRQDCFETRPFLLADVRNEPEKGFLRHPAIKPLFKMYQ